MPNEYFDADGNLVEGLLTPDEVNEKIEEAKASGQQEIADQLQEAKDQLAAKELELKELAEKGGKGAKEDRNWKETRETISKLNDTIGGLTKQMEDVRHGTENKHVETSIRNLAAGDRELEKKIRFHFNEFSPINPKLTDEERSAKVEERIQNAYTIATGGQKRVPVSSMASGGGEPGFTPVLDERGKGKLENLESMEVAKKLGISDDEAKESGLI